MTSTHAESPTIAAIKHELHAQKINQSELARRLGWGRMQVQRRLAGDAQLTVSELQEIAAALGVPVTRFLADQPAVTP